MKIFQLFNPATEDLDKFLVKKCSVVKDESFF